MKKSYPRAKVARHKVLDGWTVELLLRAGAKPIKVNATYATIPFAHKAALTKLGVKVAPGAVTAKPEPIRQAPSATPTPIARPAVPMNAGTCIPCGRPMRHPKYKASEYPGTVLRQRDGLCQSCNQSSKKKAS